MYTINHTLYTTYDIPYTLILYSIYYIYYLLNSIDYVVYKLLYIIYNIKYMMLYVVMYYSIAYICIYIYIYWLYKIFDMKIYMYHVICLHGYIHVVCQICTWRCICGRWYNSMNYQCSMSYSHAHAHHVLCSWLTCRYRCIMYYVLCLHEDIHLSYNIFAWRYTGDGNTFTSCIL